MRRTRPSMSALAALFLLWSAAARASAAEPPADEDPWTGKPRAEVVHLLGEPAKAKTARDGAGETLTYRFYRLHSDAPPPDGALLVQVPGVGPLVRVDRRTLGAAAPMAIEPTDFDEQGRPMRGGVQPIDRASTSYSVENREVRRSWRAADNPSVGGKVKLRFELDADGIVTGWSATGKKK